ncbi:hypothetical protein TA3x_003568 [Tundrisphaera sp. TA3]|uniref:hypothetical protein n=1 Tax=Tundrisphaera sp. TA3 TaxID=3435775 RepID=UPI003EBF5B83
MNRVEAYLRIPAGYAYAGNCAFDPRWSANGDAIEYGDGTTLCFANEVALFLEGYASVGPLIHFAHIVNLMLLLDGRNVQRRVSVMGKSNKWFPDEPYTPREIEEHLAPFAEWTRKYREAGRRARNGGALCARICRGLPITVDPPDPREIIVRLGDGSLRAAMAVHRNTTSPLADEVETPSMSGVVFEAFFFSELGKLPPEEVDHWFRHGTAPPGDAGPEIAREIIARKPPAVAGLLETLEARERLAGAAPMVSQMVGALALPPRRRTDHGLPTGGYADIGNRGSIDRILPGQLAVDPDEFVRRFAENELLYFRREEPHEPIGEDLTILLDQGVRCWGRVRLVLAAAAIALGRNADRKGRPWRIGGTSTDGRLLDPAADDSDALASFWEASDLSADPAPALEAVLEARGFGAGTPGDVVVLSHPRSLAAPDFAAASRRAGPGTRLFTVSADEPGRVELAEWRHGAKVPIAAFRVDPRPDPAPAGPRRGDPRAWSGDIEPVPFPFRMGLDDQRGAVDFAFDHDAHRLALTGLGGMLHAWSLDGSAAETLPRGLAGGAPMADVTNVVGVANGFFAGGLTASASLAGVHYDYATRTVRSYHLAATADAAREWFYLRRLHAVVARTPTETIAVELSTGLVHRAGPAGGDRRGAARPMVIRVASAYPSPPHRLTIRASGDTLKAGASISLEPKSGSIQLDGVSPPWSEFTPMDQGQPSLQGGLILEAQLRGDILVIRAIRSNGPPGLLAFQGPAGTALREFSPHASCTRFALSADGSMIAARLIQGPRLMVLPTVGAGQPAFVVPQAKSHPGLTLTLGPMGMALRVGRRATIVSWSAGRLVSWALPGWAQADPPPRPSGALDAGPLTVPASKIMTLPRALDRIGGRFVACARSNLTAVLDRFGQIALFDADERLVAMILAYRGQVAAWMPDGTRLGPPTLIDGADADAEKAARAIGHALREASLRGSR